MTPDRADEPRGMPGRVDELPQHHPRRDNMNKRQEGSAQFLIPRGHAAEFA